MTNKKDKKREEKKKKEEQKNKEVPKHKCRSCDKPMYKPNKQCNVCKNKKKLKKKLNSRGQKEK